MNSSKLTICPLASGSKGNSLYVGFGTGAVLVDAGISGAETELRMEAVGLSPESIRGILITHDHTDHIKGAGVLSRRYGIPLYITEKTFASCRKLGKVKNYFLFNAGDSFSVDELHVSSFSVSHDASDPVGFSLDFANCRIGITTDLGEVTDHVRECLKGSSLLYVESNHDPAMLMNGSYTMYLKEKIRSREGHLANSDTMDLVQSLIHDGLEHLVLAHLSEENNCPKLVREMFLPITEPAGIELHIAEQGRPGRIININCLG